MSSKSEQERERLKEEYKDHYRKIRDTKEKLRRSQYVHNVNEALNKMNTDDLLSSVDHFLGNVRDKMSHIEARLDVAMEGFLENHDSVEELDEELKKEHARESIKEIKREMGMLYSEIEQQAKELNIDKTVGRGKQEEPKSSENKGERE